MTRGSSRSNDGFTLIELMIVVAIIGILASLAIPNFLKFQCRAKQSEAKGALSGMFTAEKAFFGEYNTYGTDLISISWNPDGAPVYLYGTAVTFPSGSVSGLPSFSGARNTTLDPSVIGSPRRYNTGKMKNLAGIALTSADLPSTALSGASFTIGAAGDISPKTGSTLVDRWTINNTRTLTNVLNDCSN